MITNAPTMIQQRMLLFVFCEAAITDVDARTTAAYGDDARTTEACEEALSAALNELPVGAWRELAATTGAPKTRASVM